MAYPASMLNDGEDIIFDRHPHWSFMIGAVAMSVAAFLVTVVIGAFDISLVWIGLIVMLLALIGTLGRYLRWKTIEFVLTTDRIIVRQGILSKAGIEIPLERVMNISYHQALWERILGTGDLVVESAGENGHQAFSDVKQPSHVQNLLYKQMELASGNGPRSKEQDGFHDQHNHHATGQDPQQPDNTDIPQQIAKLDELRNRGILSDEEFEKKKRQLLDRM